MTSVKNGLSWLSNLRKYVKYIEATVKTVEFAIEQFGSVNKDAETQAVPASPVSFPNENLEDFQ